jgi:hypothetical protein
MINTFTSFPILWTWRGSFGTAFWEWSSLIWLWMWVCSMEHAVHTPADSKNPVVPGVAPLWCNVYSSRYTHLIFKVLTYSLKLRRLNVQMVQSSSLESCSVLPLLSSRVGIFILNVGQCRIWQFWMIRNVLYRHQETCTVVVVRFFINTISSAAVLLRHAGLTPCRCSQLPGARSRYGVMVRVKR